MCAQGTQHIFADTLKRLLKEESFQKIRVSDLCKEAGLSRKSFYNYFEDKYELLIWIFEMDMKRLLYTFGLIEKEKHCSLEEMLRDVLPQIPRKMINKICEAYLTYLREHDTFYIAALSYDGQNSFRAYFARILEVITFIYIDEVYILEEDRHVFAEFYADAYLVSIEKWLIHHKKLSPKEYLQLVQPLARDDGYQGFDKRAQNIFRVLQKAK